MNYSSIDLIKNKMSEDDIKVISFDVFDTLLVRRICTVDDLYRLLNKKFRKLTDSNLDFGKVRIESEQVLRREIIRGERDKEDFFIDEIYDLISRDYQIPAEVSGEMLQEELSIERDVCFQRKSGKTLFDFAKTTGKKIIMVSDMYLRKEHIEDLLRANGYEGYDDIFVSSEVGLRKTTGHLYEYVAKVVNVSPDRIFHIGDNPQNDIENAEKKGFNTAWLPSTFSCYMSHGCAHQAEKMCKDLVDWEVSVSEPGVSVSRQMAANMYFDDPFRIYDDESDYNADPYFVGYAALGLHVLALTKWIIDQLRRDNAEKIIFLARDGYLPMKVYEMIREKHPDIPKAEYLHTSRMAVLPAIVKTPEDLFQIPIDKRYHTPEKFLEKIDFCAKENAWEIMQANGRYKNYKSGEILTADAFHGFVSDFISCAYDKDKHEMNKRIISEYLLGNKESAITDNSVLFDSGYSGRMTSAIRDLTGKQFLVYFIHVNGNSSFFNEAIENYKIRSFLDFSPYMEAALREYAYLEPVASCIGYTEGKEAIFDEGPDEEYKKTVTLMQKGALDFVRDFLDTFDKYENETEFRSLSAAIPFEAFLRFCSEKDRHIFDGICFDDELWGGRRDIDLNYLMDARISKLPGYATHH